MSHVYLRRATVGGLFDTIVPLRPIYQRAQTNTTTESTFFQKPCQVQVQLPALNQRLFAYRIVRNQRLAIPSIHRIWIKICHETLSHALPSAQHLHDVMLCELPVPGSGFGMLWWRRGFVEPFARNNELC